MKINEKYIEDLEEVLDRDNNTSLVDSICSDEKFIDGHMNVLPVDGKYYVIDLLYTKIYFIESYINDTMEVVYTLLLEYIYIERYKDGSHITKINMLMRRLNEFLELYNDDFEKSIVDEYIEKKEYEISYKLAAIMVDATIHKDEELMKEGGYDVGIPKDIPDFLRLENLLDLGFVDILNQYKPEECDNKWVCC